MLLGQIEDREPLLLLRISGAAFTAEAIRPIENIVANMIFDRVLMGHLICERARHSGMHRDHCFGASLSDLSPRNSRTNTVQNERDGELPKHSKGLRRSDDASCRHRRRSAGRTAAEAAPPRAESAPAGRGQHAATFGPR